MTETTHGRGAIRKKLDLRDKKYSRIGKSSKMFDWNIGFEIELTTLVKDQGNSSSCGGQAASYLAEVLESLYKLEAKPRSAKYIYSQIYYPQGGTTIRDIGNFLVKKGISLETIVSSYDNGEPPSEPFMRDRSKNVNGDASASLCEPSGYAFVDANIDSYAQAIRDNNGIIMECQGQNNGTWLGTVPIPPNNQVGTWDHFMVGLGAKLINGKKAIKIRNSWGAECGENGYQWITEDFFKGGWVHEGLTIYAKDAPHIDERQTVLVSLYTQALAVAQQIINLLRGNTKQNVK